MKHKHSIRLFSVILALMLLFTLTAGASDPGVPPGGFTGEVPPGGFGGGGNVPAPPPGGGSMTFYTGAAVTDVESGDYSDTIFTDSANEEEVAVRVGPGITASFQNATVTKSAGDTTGDDSSFYGVNSGILAYSEDSAAPASLTMEGGKVETSASGANGVFAYGKSTIDLKNVEVITKGQGGSGGIMVAGGGTLYAEDCYVVTEGGSSAAIRSDRGSGLMTIDGGTYISNGSLGTGSPAVYCVADITVANATMQANNAQAICFEGRNPFHMYNCYLEGNYTASDDDENCNVMVYQSMSGDSEEGTTYCTMVGGVLKANNVSENGNAKMFYTTNTYSYISLCDVEIVYPEGMDTFLLCACNTNQRGWGTAGANGSECVMYTVDQDIDGNIIYDTWSYLGLYMTDDTDFEGAILCREDNGERGCDLYMDADSEWTVTGDSVVRDFYTGGAEIEDQQDKTVSIVGADGIVYVQGNSAYTVTVTGTFGTDDLTAFENVPGIGTVKDGEYTFDIHAGDDLVDLNYIPTSPDGKVYGDTMWHEDAEEAPPAEIPAEAPAEPPVEAPADAPAEEPAAPPAEEPAETPAEAPVEEPAEAPVEPPAETPAAEPESSFPVGIVAVFVIGVAVGIACVAVYKKKKK